MADYCITAANHKNPNNHVASSFLVWVLDTPKNTWQSLGSKSASEVVGLVEKGHKVYTAKLNAEGTAINLGEPVEVELRIEKNSTNYDISKMPRF
ncbi:hypothetical protein [Trinickia mobilis]|uniref:hypothetical protein n=1 Tax=Trinickia mobilis TaxID=2816356 RepID=UPI001A8FB75E|nr:hypothetical protein [Trinickia mobilis]